MGSDPRPQAPTPRVVTTPLDVLVVSAGGVGTSFLMHFLKHYCWVNCPHDMDGLKHAPVPPYALFPGLKAIYIVGDPIEATISLFRRGYQHAQARKLIPPSATELPEPESLETLDRYAAFGQDCFQFEAHYRRWRHRPTAYPILFIKYRSIWKHLDAIFEFLNLPRHYQSNFPSPKPRHSSLEQLPSTTREGLERMYGQFSRYVASLPNIDWKPKTHFRYFLQLPQIPNSIRQNKQTIYPRLIASRLSAKLRS